MPLEPVPDVAKVVAKGHIGSHPMQVVFHVAQDGPLSLVDAQAIGDTYGAIFENWLPAPMNASCGWDTMEIYGLDTVPGPQFSILPATWPFVGLLTEGALPPSTAACIAWRGATGGRSGRGRSYLGGFDEDASDGDSPDFAAMTALMEFADDMIATTSLVIVSRYLGTDKTIVNKRNVPIPRATPLVTPVITRAVNPRWASQRRRADLV